VRTRQALMGIGLPAILIWIVLSLAAWLDPQLAQDEWWLLLFSAPILCALAVAVGLLLANLLVHHNLRRPFGRQPPR
jgi:hypothetical protein